MKFIPTLGILKSNDCEENFFSTLNRFFILLGISLLLNEFFIWDAVKRNTVVSVSDGDTIVLGDQRRIRLEGIDAPEMGKCMGNEARVRLEGLVLGKIVHVDGDQVDRYSRLLGMVWVGKTLVNKVMLSEGLAKYETFPGDREEMKAAYDGAKSSKVGIFSPLCSSKISQTDCTIKGNIRNNQKIYILPLCNSYTNTIIDTSYGDEWFCTEEEAQTAGFRKSGVPNVSFKKACHDDLCKWSSCKGRGDGL